MKVREPYKCDGCGLQRANDTNHWWLIRAQDTPSHRPQIVIEAWWPRRADYPGMKHACGVDCMMKTVAHLAQQLLESLSSASSAVKSDSVPLPETEPSDV